MLESETDLEIEYKPCKKCGSTNYDNANWVEPVNPDEIFTADGKIIYEPTTCDVCDFSLLIPTSNYEH